MMWDDPRIGRLVTLITNALNPPAGATRIILALAFGLMCHLIFAVAVLAMITAMFFGMSKSLGAVPWPWATAVNALLILQFPLLHSWLLTNRGGRFLSFLVPGRNGATLSTTTYATIASIQLLLLFALWTPSGIIWWQAEGWIFWVICTAYGCSWFLLAKASFDAGAEVQSGALGWMSLLAKIKPVFPDMPTAGLFRFIRHPIYAAFTLTLWTVPTWTPDQLALAICLTAYCLLSPILKEKRFLERYGDQFRRYREQVPYMFPSLKLNKSSHLASSPSERGEIFQGKQHEG